MEQLSLFTPMEESLETVVEQLHQTVWYIKPNLILPEMRERFEELKATGKHRDAHSLAMEFVL